MCQRADWVETHVAPQLEPDLVADPIENRRFHPRGHEQTGETLDIRRDFAGRFAERKIVAIDVTDHARSFDFGCGIDDAADSTLWAELAPLPAAGIDALKRGAFITTAVLVEVPIGNAVYGGNDARARTQQGLHPIDHAGDGMGLKADDQVVLLAQFCRIVRAARVHHAFLAAHQQLQSVLPHGGEMHTARDQADVGACAHEFNTEIATDGTSAVNADLHEPSQLTSRNERLLV